MKTNNICTIISIYLLFLGATTVLCFALAKPSLTTQGPSWETIHTNVSMQNLNTSAQNNTSAHSGQEIQKKPISIDLSTNYPSFTEGFPSGRFLYKRNIIVGNGTWPRRIVRKRESSSVPNYFREIYATYQLLGRKLSLFFSQLENWSKKHIISDTHPPL